MEIAWLIKNLCWADFAQADVIVQIFHHLICSREEKVVTTTTAEALHPLLSSLALFSDMLCSNLNGQDWALIAHLKASIAPDLAKELLVLRLLAVHAQLQGKR